MMLDLLTKAKTIRTSKVGSFKWPKIPSISAANFSIAKIISGIKRETKFKLGQSDLILSLPGHVDQSHLTERTDIQIGAIHFEAWTPPGFLGQVLVVRGFNGQIAENLNENADLVTEFLLERTFEHMTSEFGSGVAFTSRSVPPSGLPALHVPLSVSNVDGQSIDFAISADLDTLTRILKLAVEDKIETTGLLKDTFKWPMVFLGADLEVPIEDLVTLELGDGLIIEDPKEATKQRSVLIGDRLLGSAAEKIGDIQLTSSLKSLCDSNFSKFGFYDMINRLNDGDDTVDLTVTVNLEIARTDVTLLALQDMAIGSILPFNTELPETVRLLVDNEVIAKGELVQLEGKIAVRITKLDDV